MLKFEICLQALSTISIFPGEAPRQRLQTVQHSRQRGDGVAVGEEAHNNVAEIYPMGWLWVRPEMVCISRIAKDEADVRLSYFL